MMSRVITVSIISKQICKKRQKQIWINSTFIVEKRVTESLIEALWLSHGALDVERSDILPVLLQQRHQEIHRQVDVVDQLILGHLDVTNGNSQTQNLKTISKTRVGNRLPI